MTKKFTHRKITNGVAQISLGLKNKLVLGNLKAKRDWGFAGDYVKAMWMMLQQEKSDDYVIATGEIHTVQDFVECVFNYAELDYKKYVVQDKSLRRPQEVPALQGDCTKAKRILDWTPTVKFEELAQMMYQSDYKHLKK